MTAVRVVLESGARIGKVVVLRGKRVACLGNKAKD